MFENISFDDAIAKAVSYLACYLSACSVKFTNDYIAFVTVCKKNIPVSIEMLAIQTVYIHQISHISRKQFK